MSDDPIEARRVEELLRRLADDAAAGELGDVETYLAAFPSLGERVREEYARLVDDPTTVGSAPGGAEPADGMRVGPYRIRRELGRGGQGVVYLADDERHGRRVALKLLPTPLGLRSARVRREIDAIARLDHPGLCVVYDAGEVDGRAYVAMRHVDGEPLDALARRFASSDRTGPRSGSRARGEVVERVELVEKIARALQAAHDVGVTHRDVKPANVLVRPDRDPVLLDFGLARVDDAVTLTHSGELLGTLPYMAPERLAGEAGDAPVSDVWSLGVTLYELLAGRRPFEAPTLDAVARRIERDEPPDLARVAPGVPRDLSVVVATALSKDPLRRYPSAAALADDLERWRTGRPIAARPVGVVGRLLRWARRNPAAAALVGVLVAALAGALVSADRMGDLAERETRARRVAQAMLVRASYDQARLELRDRRVSRAAELADRAARAYARLDVEPGDADDPELRAALSALPSAAELRALAAELDGLVQVVPERIVQRSTFGQGALSHAGSALVQGWIADDMSSYGVRVVDVATGDELGRLTDYDLMSTRFSLAVTDDARFCVAPRRDVAAIGLWSLRSGRCEAWLDVPDDLADGTHGDGAWRLAFADGARRVVGVLTSRDGPDGVVVWAHGVDVDAPRAPLPYATAASLTDLDHVAPALVDRDPIAPDAWLAPTRDPRVVLVPGGHGVVRRFDVVDGVLDAFELPHAVDAARASPDGRAVVALSRGGSVSRALAPPAGPVTTFDVGDGLRAAVDVAADGRTVATVDVVGTLRLLDAATGEELVRRPDALEETPSIDALRFVDDGRALVSHPARGATTVWRVDGDRGWCGSRLVRPAGDARAWAPDASGGALVEVAADGRATWRDAERIAGGVTLDGTWHGVRAGDGAWALLGADAVRRVDGAGGLGVGLDVTPGSVAVDAVARAGGLRVVTRGAGGELDVVDVSADGTRGEAQRIDAPREADVVLSDDGRRLVVAPLTGARPGSGLSTGAVLVHDLATGAVTSLEGLDTGFREVDGPRVARDGRHVAAHVFRPDASGGAGGDHFVGLWDLSAGGALSARTPSLSAVTASATAFVDGRWLAVARTGGEVALHDLSTPEAEAWLVWRALDDDVVPRLVALDGALVVWRAGAPDHARRFDVARLVADLGARGLAER